MCFRNAESGSIPSAHQNPSILNHLQIAQKGLNSQMTIFDQVFLLKLRLPFESVARRVPQLLGIYMRSNV